MRYPPTPNRRLSRATLPLIAAIIATILSLAMPAAYADTPPDIPGITTALLPFKIYMPVVFKNFTPVTGNSNLSDVAVDPNTGQVFVASLRSNAVHVIDGGTNTRLRSVGVANGPTGVAVLTSTVLAPGSGSFQFVNDKIFVTHLHALNNWKPGAKVFSAFDTAARDVGPDGGYVGAGPAKVAANNNLGRVYISNKWDKLAVIDGTANPETRLGWVAQKGWQGAYGIDASEATGRVYLAARDTGELVIFDGNGDRLLQPGYIPAHIAPPQACALFDVAVNEATGHVFVTCPALGRVFVLDESLLTLPRTANATTLEKRNGSWARVMEAAAAPWIADILIPGGVGSGEEGIAVDPGTGWVFITNAAQNRVYLLQDSPSGSVWLPPMVLVSGFNTPQGIAINPNTHRVYVANAGDNTLRVLEGTSPFTGVVTISLP